jgi:hypothetical protein
MAKQFNVVEYMVNPLGDTFKKEKKVAGPLPKSKAEIMRSKMSDKLGDFDPSQPLVSYVVVPA